MLSRFERTVAWRYLRPGGRQGFASVVVGFSLLGILIGVATLIIVMSVMNGFRTELLGRILGLNGHIHVYAAQGDFIAFDDAIDVLRGLDGITSAVPIAEGQALANVNRASGGVLIRGMRQEDLATIPLLSSSIVSGSLDLMHGDVVAIGERLAFRMRLKIGDSLTLVSPRGAATAFGTLPRAKSYRVVAIFDVGMYEYDNGFVFMPFDRAQRFLGLRDRATNIEVRLNDPFSSERVGDRIRRAVPEAGRVFDWRQSNASFFAAVEVERNVMFLILTLIILVADFNIITGMVMLVKDKTRDIAILRTMGASQGAVLRIFLFAGTAIGLIGTGFGVLIGVSFVQNIDEIRLFLEGLTGASLWQAEIRFLSRVPAELDWTQVGGIGAMALGLAFLATIYPAWRAARLDPVKALRDV